MPGSNPVSDAVVVAATVPVIVAGVAVTLVTPLASVDDVWLYANPGVVLRLLALTVLLRVAVDEPTPVAAVVVTTGAAPPFTHTISSISK